MSVAMSDHFPQPYAYDEDEVIIRVINENTQLLIDLEEQRMKAVSKLKEALEAYRAFLERESMQSAIKWTEEHGRPF